MDAIKKTNKKVFERAGYRPIYTRLMKAGYFSNMNESPMDAVKNSIYEIAIKYISIENSLN